MNGEIINFKHLNDEQQQAVKTTNGPLLVLAGAGTGKTRVLTTRIAHILHSKIALANQILAVTFTNKAANEIKNRIINMVDEAANSLWCGTFHSITMRMLRNHAEAVGFNYNFTILNYDDQLQLVKQIQKVEGINEKLIPPRHVLYFINKWKDNALLPENLTEAHFSQYYKNGCDPIIEIYHIYQKRLQIMNTMDFGNLLLYGLLLLKNNPDILAIYQNQLQYILVDEYQDTNVVQYLWLRLLAKKNICCVGDEDQSIYGWRGAKIDNILKFEQDYPDAKIIRLEQNYRSNCHILKAASGLISHNKNRLGKTLWTAKKTGDKILIKDNWSVEEEAQFVGRKIISLQLDGVLPQSIAVLVRAAHQTREFEEQFIALKVAYKVIGGFRFYERKEIKDAIAYLRVIHSFNDSLAFERIINVPRRGVGNASLQILHERAKNANESLFHATQYCIQNDILKGKIKATLTKLINNFMRWSNQLNKINLCDLAKIVLDESEYTDMLQKDKNLDAGVKLENLKEFTNSLQKFDTLDIFLEHVSLVLDNINNTAENQVIIMTLHSAKGLEFDTVFLVGWEEGLFPHHKSIEEGNLEEERRLAYVGLTRAQNRAIITFSHSRFLYGSWINSLPSRFINEIPQESKDNMNSNYDNKYQMRGYQTNSSMQNSYKNAIKYGDNKFRPNDRIYHDNFGYGIITDVSGDNLFINFDLHGRKIILENFIKLADNKIVI